MSCNTRFKAICLGVGERLDYYFNWTLDFAKRWEANYGFGIGAKIRPATEEGQTGFEYESSGGQSGPEEPEWPRVLGGTVEDGSITWTARALSNDGLLERIDTVEWPAVDGFTITPITPIDEPGRQITGALITADTAFNGRRNIVAEVTTTANNEVHGIFKARVR